MAAWICGKLASTAVPGDKLLDCQAAICTQAAWAADGRRLIYERRPLSAEGQVIDAPQLWWLDSQTGETLTVFADEAQGGVAARLSPNGRYLSATLPDDQEIHVTDLESGAVLVIPSQTGEAAVWSPDSETLLVSDMQYQGEQFSIHLFRANVESGELTNLSGVDLQTSDGQPVFSPDGEWIAFTRKKPERLWASSCGSCARMAVNRGRSRKTQSGITVTRPGRQMAAGLWCKWFP
ncbi:MAG: hypothetical protein M5U34_49075 [Chloroflexi bacterium]|nr:hypothetical protein [Chloroflexota bacterium]